MKRKYVIVKDTRFKGYYHFLLKFKVIKNMDSKLSMMGNPLKLNGVKYVIVKCILTACFFLISVLNQNSLFQILFNSILSFFLVDVFILLKEKSVKDMIENDLMHIVEMVYLQLSAYVPINIVFKNMQHLCKNTYFKRVISSFSNCYEYSGYNIYKSIGELKEQTNVIEVDMFCNSLIEYIVSVDNLESFLTLSNLLREKNIERIKRSTTKKIFIITIGVSIALLNISLIVFYPIVTSFNSNFKNIFY